MGLKIEGNRIEGQTAPSYYSDPVESELVEDTSINDGESFQEASVDIDNALLNGANNLWIAFYKTKECVSDNWYANESFHIKDLSNRETGEVLITFSNDGSKTRIFTRLLNYLDTYYLKITINYENNYGNILLISNNTQIDGDIIVNRKLEIKNNLFVGGDLVVDGDLVLGGHLCNKDGWWYQLVTNKPTVKDATAEKYCFKTWTLGSNYWYIHFTNSIVGTEINLYLTFQYYLRAGWDNDLNHYYPSKSNGIVQYRKVSKDVTISIPCNGSKGKITLDQSDNKITVSSPYSYTYNLVLDYSYSDSSEGHILTLYLDSPLNIMFEPANNNGLKVEFNERVSSDNKYFFIGDCYLKSSRPL